MTKEEFEALQSAGRSGIHFQKFGYSVKSIYIWLGRILTPSRYGFRSYI